jgi:hypothetical protein
MGRAFGMYGEVRVAYRVLVGNPEQKDNLENVSVERGIIIHLQKMEWGCGLD